MRGFPVREERCEHGAGRGAICEHCAGPVNFQLRLLEAVHALVEGTSGTVPPGLLSEAVRVRDALRAWATDRGVCVAAAGPCACFRCAGGT